jgi:hypothetical protein
VSPRAAGFEPSAYVHSKLVEYGDTRPSSLSDHEPTADERRGIIHRLQATESVRFELSPGVTLEVSMGREGLEVREMGLSGSRNIAILPSSSNTIYVTTVRV